MGLGEDLAVSGLLADSVESMISVLPLILALEPFITTG